MTNPDLRKNPVFRAVDEAKNGKNWHHNGSAAGRGLATQLYRGVNAHGVPTVMVQTSRLDADTFAEDMAGAIAEIASEPTHAADIEGLIRSALMNAFPIAFSLSGYKADRVATQKLLTCGDPHVEGLALLYGAKV